MKNTKQMTEDITSYLVYLDMLMVFLLLNKTSFLQAQLRHHMLNRCQSEVFFSYYQKSNARKEQKADSLEFIYKCLLVKFYLHAVPLGPSTHGGLHAAEWPPLYRTPNTLLSLLLIHRRMLSLLLSTDENFVLKPICKVKCDSKALAIPTAGRSGTDTHSSPASQAPQEGPHSKGHVFKLEVVFNGKDASLISDTHSQQPSLENRVRLNCT